MNDWGASAATKNEGVTSAATNDTVASVAMACDWVA
jgi:hypothetical protein